ncbi:hypothetical protein [Clostridium ljungdahlii]|uniref:Uncharacterized protein n=1 Tax=Clostridium ljungdahlii TaxID=1538 RepID=A0A166RZI9_9CLOT|nr:hypothetical protein [Clostridium ljungdahlii]OAA91397.1 hypothetical protein WY13_00654 [Clostridium ljungdahlii]
MPRLRKTKRIKKNKKFKAITLICFILIILVASFCNYKFHFRKKLTSSIEVSSYANSHKSKKTQDAIPKNALNSIPETTDSQNKDLRKFPYPYSSMLAICSDIDDGTLEEFKTYHKFLNTRSETSYGQGLGLDIGDSFWMYMGDNSNSVVDVHGRHNVKSIMTFFNGTSQTEKHNADEITHYIRSGWIDCIHTFGDFSTENQRGTLFNRNLAENAWNVLNSENLKPTVWINHGNKANKQNFGAYGTGNFMSYQQGDNPKSPYYHTDITLKSGIKYVWDSWSDHKFGHDYPLYEISLRDGKKVWGFHRYTNDLVNNKIDWIWTPKYIHRQLTKANLDSIVNNKQYSIVAQHLGIDTEDLFTQDNISSLKLLKEYQDNNKIIVAKTSRVLNYANSHKYLTYQKLTQNGKTYVNITSISDPIFGIYIPTIDDIRGITFYCDNPKNTVLLINESKIGDDNLKVNPKDETGKASISIKWFKPNYKDYTQQ